MGYVRSLLKASAAAALLVAAAAAQGASTRDDYTLREDYIHDPLPPGVQVIATELNGPVFADANGHTLYRWQIGAQRNGDAGEQKGKPTCDNYEYTENAGLISRYPGGLT